MVRRFGVLVLVLFTATGCLPPPAPAPTPAPLPTESPRTPLDLCRPGSFDPGRYPDVVANGRGSAPELVDDLAAYAVGLLPAGLLDHAGLTVRPGRSGGGSPVGIEDGVLTMEPASDIAPSELAYGLVLVSVAWLLESSGSYDPDDPSEAVQLRIVAQTLAADTYINLAVTHPESTQGPHDPELGVIERVRARLAGDRTATADEVDPGSSPAPGRFVGDLASRFGPDYYQVKQGSVVQTRVPLAFDEVNPLLDALLAKC